MAGYVRFLFAIMLCIANMIIYGLKVNITTAIIGMVKTKAAVNGSLAQVAHECPQFENVSSNGPTDIQGPYEWSSTEQGLVVSLYFGGYLLGMFPAGYFSDRFNTKYVLLISVFANSIFALLVPWAAEHGVYVLLFLRFMTGLVSAVNLPVVNVLVGKWVVYEEKSTWVGIIYAGTSIGTVISILSSGLIMERLGWEKVFYIHGVLPLIWCVLFAIFFADNPETQKFISEPERELIVKSYGHRQLSSTKIQVPWRAIFTSKPFWALVVTNCFGNFVWYFLLTQLPRYMNKINICTPSAHALTLCAIYIGSAVIYYYMLLNAMISCSPYLINAITNPLLGKILDYGRRKGCWSQTNARKIAVGVSCIPPSIMLLIIAYIGCERTGTTVLLILSIVVGGAIFVGHLTNQNDLAPNYAGILMGITNTPGTISAFVLPALVGALTENGDTFESWRYVIWINVISQIIAFTVFTLFGSAKIQSWNYPEGHAPIETTREIEKNKDEEDDVTSKML